MWQALHSYFFTEGYKLVEWAKCGESLASVIPTLLWSVGTAALTHRLLRVLFRRFLFRRVPMWELMFQNLLFIWMVIYSLHFWVMLVKIIKIFIDYLYGDAPPLGFQQQKPLASPVDAAPRQVMQQWVIWMFGALPLAVFLQTRPRPEPPPLMIWITTRPWLRREMGPYGYYLNRPLPSSTTVSAGHQPLSIRKAFSESNILIKEPPNRKRHSKSV